MAKKKTKNETIKDPEMETSGMIPNNILNTGIEESIMDYIMVTEQINKENGWREFDPKDNMEAFNHPTLIPSLISLQHSEASEALEAWRGQKVFVPLQKDQLNAFGKPLNYNGEFYVYYRGESYVLGFMKKQTREEALESFIEENTDELIRLFDTMSYFPKVNWNVELAKKLLKNSKRGYKHGGKKI